MEHIVGTSCRQPGPAPIQNSQDRKVKYGWKQRLNRVLMIQSRQSPDHGEDRQIVKGTRSLQTAQPVVEVRFDSRRSNQKRSAVDAYSHSRTGVYLKPLARAKGAPESGMRFTKPEFSTIDLVPLIQARVKKL